MRRNPIFALPKPQGDGTGLTHGVTVALQILVLSVKVRILMGQQKGERVLFFPFFYLYPGIHDGSAFHGILHFFASPAAFLSFLVRFSLFKSLSFEIRYSKGL